MPFANINGVRLFYDIYGTGEPVVLIHGIAVTSRMWDFQKEELPRHYKMIVYDLRGSGRSQKTPDTFHTAELMSEDLKGLLDYLELGRVNVVGLSMGSAIAMKFAINYPHMVNRLVLSGGFVDLDGVLNALRKYFAPLIGWLLMTRFFGELATKLMLPSVSRKQLLYYHRNIISIDYDEVRKYRQILSSYSITSALNKIISPTLILYGSLEPPLHKYGRMINKEIKNSEMRIIPGVGHGWNGEKPGLFNHTIIDFLSSNSNI